MRLCFRLARSNQPSSSLAAIALSIVVTFSILSNSVAFAQSPGGPGGPGIPGSMTSYLCLEAEVLKLCSGTTTTDCLCLYDARDNANTPSTPTTYFGACGAMEPPLITCYDSLTNPLNSAWVSTQVARDGVAGDLTHDESANASGWTVTVTDIQFRDTYDPNLAMITAKVFIATKDDLKVAIGVETLSVNNPKTATCEAQDRKLRRVEFETSPGNKEEFVIILKKSTSGGPSL